jgi:3-oxoacyl-[acyl-carrier-protein] synthase II
MGAITPIGLNVEEFWQGLIQGKSGITRISYFDTTNFTVKVAAEVNGFEPQKYLEPKLVDRTAKFTQFGIAAAKMAVESACLDMSQERSEKVGVIMANTIALDYIGEGMEIVKTRGPRRVEPLFINKVAPHMSSVLVGMAVGARGPNTTVNSACASGSDAIATALNHLRLGHADVMLAGGAETMVQQLTIAAAGIIGALSRQPDPAKACRPFDLNRDGFIYGEGSGVLVLETLEHAKRRGAPILAELAGVGWSFDSCDETAPDPAGEAIAIKTALDNAGVAPEEIDYINAHGTSTKLNDASETKAIKMVLGERAYQIPISSNKSMTGHMVAAAGIVEAIATVLTINRGIIPPTINYETPDPECDLDYVPNVARHAEVNTCLSNSFGLGGQNCCLVIKRFEG